MIRRVIIGGLIALTLLGAGIAIGAAADADWGRHRDAVVVSSGSDTTGQTIVVRDGHGPAGFFFFPFGLLLFVLVLVLVFSLVKRGSRGGPWRYGGGGPAWLEDWHRRAHEGDAPGPGDVSSV
jgi:hypothetical protein